jgi:hypothetical protein
MAQDIPMGPAPIIIRSRGWFSVFKAPVFVVVFMEE